MFEGHELSKGLSEDKTKLTVIVPFAAKDQCIPANFLKLADFINSQAQCHTLRFLAQFSMSHSDWAAFGTALASTGLGVLVLVGNYLGKLNRPGFGRIDDLMTALNPNGSLYSLDVRDCHMERTSVDSLGQHVLDRPLWLSVKATQSTEVLPSCRLVDGSVAQNREKITQAAISVAQAAATTGAVPWTKDFRGLFGLPRDLIKIIVEKIYFSGKPHPVSDSIASRFIKAHQIALGHRQAPLPEEIKNADINTVPVQTTQPSLEKSLDSEANPTEIAQGNSIGNGSVNTL